MNTNSKVDQLANAARHSANEGAVNPSMFLVAVAVSIALLGLTAGWLGHRPALVVQKEVEATTSKMAPQAAKVQARHMPDGEKVRNSQQPVCLEIPAMLKRDCATRGSINESSQLFRGIFVEDICLQSNWWMKAKAVAEQAQESVNRARELQATGVISPQELEARQRDLDLAQSSERAARANVDLAVALCGEVKRLDSVAEHAAQRIAELEVLVAELRLTSRIDDNAQD